MPVTVPATFTDGQVVTSAQLTSIQTAVNNLSQTVTGYTESGYTTTPLSVGKSDSGNFSKPNVKAFVLTNELMATGTEATLTLPQANVNVSGAWIALAGGSFTVTQPGWYRVEYQASFDSGGAAANTERRISIGLNGIAVANQVASVSTLQGIANNVRLQCSALLHLASGDVLYPIFYHANGTSIVLLDNLLWGCWLHAIWEAPY